MIKSFYNKIRERRWRKYEEKLKNEFFEEDGIKRFNQKINSLRNDMTTMKLQLNTIIKLLNEKKN